jgi:hypothetical protein
MNSDFMQQHAERLAERLADEPDDPARIEKAYRTIFGRAPTAEEIAAGRDFLKREALSQYEDRRAEAAKAEKAEPEKKADADGGNGGKDDGAMEGMMAGVVPGVKTGAPAEKMLPVTTLGRYIKILLSSNEFLFVE